MVVVTPILAMVARVLALERVADVLVVVQADVVPIVRALVTILVKDVVKEVAKLDVR